MTLSVHRMRSAALLSLVAAGCGGEGTWHYEVYGEAFIEEGIPASAFEDGCAVDYTRFLVTVGGRALQDAEGTVAAAVSGVEVYDLVPGRQRMATTTAPSGTWQVVTATVASDADVTAGAGADDAAVQAVTDAPASVVATGTLTCGDRSVAFDWAFDEATAYACAAPDLVVTSGAEAVSELTIHGDHLFFDSLEDPDAVLRGLPYVDADDDGDGVLTAAELQAADVVGSGMDRGSDDAVATLWDYLTGQVRNLGHYDGEGHCDLESVDG